MAKLRKKSKGAVPSMEEASNNLTVVDTNNEKEVREELRPLNFKVPTSFKKEYKQFALDNDLSLVDVLKLSFAAYKGLH